jgi:membrane-associated phospholipid phosphatase
MRFAKFLSYTFHPIVIPTLAVLFLFIGINHEIRSQSNLTILGVVFFFSYMIPVFVLLLLKRNGKIDSLSIPEVAQRKTPIMIGTFISCILYIYSLIILGDFYLSCFFLGCIVSSLLLYVGQTRGLKISIHMTGITSLVGFLVIISYTSKIDLLLYLGALILLSGLIAYSRLRLKAHNANELLMGTIVGFGGQLISLFL